MAGCDDAGAPASPSSSPSPIGQLALALGLDDAVLAGEHDHDDPLEARGTDGVAALPTGDYEIPLVIADRGFLADGQIDFPRVGINPDNPYWTVAVPATTNIVNGRVWPNANVERRAYRFRVLIAPNARVYDIGFDNGMAFTVVGSDGGYLPAPASVQSLTLGVTERADLIVDFSRFEPGTQIVLQDIGNPSPDLGTIMRFTVQEGEAVAPPPLPETLSAVPRLVQDGRTRTKVQNARGRRARQPLRAPRRPHARPTPDPRAQPSRRPPASSAGSASMTTTAAGPRRSTI